MKKNIATIIAIVLVVAMCAVCFAACVPTDASKAQENLKGNGYSVIKLESGTLSGGITDILAGLVGDAVPKNWDTIVAGGKDKESIVIINFKDADSAKTFYNEMKETKKKASEDLEKEYKDGNITESEYNEIKEELKNTKVGKFLKTVYFGTKEAIKAAR